MRPFLVISSFVVITSAFTPSLWNTYKRSTILSSGVIVVGETQNDSSTTDENDDPIKELLKPSAINARLEVQLKKMMEKDKTSKVLTQEVSRSIVPFS